MFLEDAQQEPTRDSLQELKDAAKKLLENRKKELELQAALKLMQENINNLETVVLPEIMDRANCSVYKTPDGDLIEIKQIIQASLPSKTTIMKARSDERSLLLNRLNLAFKWLRENGAGSLIKNKIIIDIGKRDEDADIICKEISERFGITPEREEGVHPMTLTAYVKERINDAEEVPTDLFNVYMGRKAFVKIG